jgi:hypothetical protein
MDDLQCRRIFIDGLLSNHRSDVPNSGVVVGYRVVDRSRVPGTALKYAASVSAIDSYSFPGFAPPAPRSTRPSRPVTQSFPSAYAQAVGVPSRVAVPAAADAGATSS